MNGFINLGVEFWQIVVGFILLVLSIVAIRVSFQFDVNKYLESRKESSINKLMNVCPHVIYVEAGDGNIGLQSSYVSPPGTVQWRCGRCGHITYDTGGFKRAVEYYLKNPDEYVKQNDKFIKILKKMGRA